MPFWVVSGVGRGMGVLYGGLAVVNRSSNGMGQIEKVRCGVSCFYVLFARDLQGAAKKTSPLQKSNYLLNNSLFLGKLFRDYSCNSPHMPQYW